MNGREGSLRNAVSNGGYWGGGAEQVRRVR